MLHSNYGACLEGKYVSAMPLLIEATESFGLTLDDETSERWMRVTMFSSYADEFLDDSPDQEAATEYFQRVLEFALNDDTEDDMKNLPSFTSNPELSSAARLLANSVASLPPEQKQTLFHSANQISEIGLLKACCSDVNEYRDLLLQEARHTATIITESASPEVRSQGSFGKFAKWTSAVLELGVILDSYQDFADDYEKGITLVEPCFHSRKVLALQASKIILFKLIDKDSRKAVFRARKMIPAQVASTGMITE